MGKKRKKRESLEQKVLKVYYDPLNPGSYGGLARLQRATGVPIKKLLTILNKNLTYTLHKPVRRKYSTAPTVALSIDHQWAADLVDVKNLSQHNKGFKYLLTVVDVLSKYAWVVPMKNKTGSEQKRAFETILKENRKPVQLQTDKGSEFYNRTFSDYLKDQNIHHFSTHGDTKAATVERFNRTLKERMYRAFTANNMTVVYDSRKRGRARFEPQHLQFLPVRMNWLDTIEVGITENDGTPLNLQGGNTVVTLFFQKKK